jgi:(2Fe-2S) ferredoxin
MNDTHHYQRHVFMCTNQRQDGRACCAQLGGADALARCKERIKDLGLAGAGQTRVNSAGCMGRCDLGPTLVVYPEGTWYSYVCLEDIDDIVEQHLVHGQVVERLRI